MTELTLDEVGKERPRTPTTYSSSLTNSLYIRTIGVTCLIAFVSFWTQAIGLIGADGIVPVTQTLPGLDKLNLTDVRSLIAHVNVFHWIGTSDLAIHIALLLGTILSICVSLGRFPRRCLAVIWLLYFSLFRSSQPFLSYQWDILLLELVFIAILLRSTDFNGLSNSLHRQTAIAGIWLLRLVLFKLIWSSGVVKITSHDPTWQNLTALDFHFWTQPIPHQGAWYIYQLGPTFRQIGVWINHFVELAMPWLFIFSLSRALTLLWVMLATTVMLVYVGDYSIGVTLLIGLITFFLWAVERGLKTSFETARWGRKLAGCSVIGLMCSVGATGNYGFFNLLTVGLTLACFSNHDLKWLPSTLIEYLRLPSSPPKNMVINVGILTMILAVSGVNLMKVAQQTRGSSHAPSKHTPSSKVEKSTDWWTLNILVH
ncbi:MAG: lipase maturation factor family protein [Bradymonadia bacterium]